MWQKNEGTINVGLHQALDSAFFHTGLILLHEKNLCVVNLAVVSCCLFSVSETKSNQSGPKYQEARTWVLFKDP